MNNILVIDSAVSGDSSVSKALVRDAVAALAEQAPASIVHRDLGRDPVPHLTEETLAGVRGTPGTEAELATRALSDELVAELRAADVVVIGAPMYNFSIATGLRSWFDHVLRAGETFRYTEAGPEGLLQGKRAIVAYTSDGTKFGSEIDYASGYLRHMLGFFGIADVEFVAADAMAFGAEEAIGRGEAQVDALAA